MTIEIPTPLRVYAKNQSAVTVAANTVAEALTALTADYPDFLKHLYTPDGKLRSFVNLYLNDEDVRYLPQREETAVKESDTLSIIPSIAGGCCRMGGGAFGATDVTNA
ncbi:MAG TPA: MoaD/ThiS family protein [Acidobacteriaceae bacterium]|jgi:sulfur-carrier protein|nr:MoaD/ThiS family protein [Acidobacteriaceae bacterium]